MVDNPKSLTGLTGFLVRRYVARFEETQDESVRAQYGYLGGWVSAVINLGLTGFKVALGLWIGSRALVADGLHSGSDMLTSIIVVIGFWAAAKPRDKEHPYGHANAELVASLIMAVLLILAGFELARDNLQTLWLGDFQVIEAHPLVLVAVAATILLKEWLYAFSKGLAKAIGSPALEADAWHHRSDSLTTIAVLAGIVGNQMGWPWADPLIGVLVAVLVGWSGVEIAKDSISPLLGENVGPQVYRQIIDLVISDEAIYNLHDIYVHKYGREHYIALHIEILGSRTPIEMHDIAAAAGNRVEKRFGGACTVHVDPVDFEGERYQQVALELKRTVTSHSEIVGFHDLQFRSEESRERIFFEFCVSPEIDELTYPELHQKVANDLSLRLPQTEIHFQLEPAYNILH